MVKRLCGMLKIGLSVVGVYEGTVYCSCAGCAGGCDAREVGSVCCSLTSSRCSTRSARY